MVVIRWSLLVLISSDYRTSLPAVLLSAILLLLLLLRLKLAHYRNSAACRPHNGIAIIGVLLITRVRVWWVGGWVGGRPNE